jgi:hypothetical protein
MADGSGSTSDAVYGEPDPDLAHRLDCVQPEGLPVPARPTRRARRRLASVAYVRAGGVSGAPAVDAGGSFRTCFQTALEHRQSSDRDDTVLPIDPPTKVAEPERQEEVLLDSGRPVTSTEVTSARTSAHKSRPEPTGADRAELRTAQLSGAALVRRP